MRCRLCFFRFKDAWGLFNRKQNPRDASFLKEDLPVGSVIVACARRYRVGSDLFIGWYVVVWCKEGMSMEQWRETGDQFSKRLRMDWPGDLGGDFEVAWVDLEDSCLSRWESSLLDFDKERIATWTGCLDDIKREVQDDTTRVAQGTGCIGWEVEL